MRNEADTDDEMVNECVSNALIKVPKEIISNTRELIVKKDRLKAASSEKSYMIYRMSLSNAEMSIVFTNFGGSIRYG
jgi:hypothetical protein